MHSITKLMTLWMICRNLGNNSEDNSLIELPTRTPKNPRILSFQGIHQIIDFCESLKYHAVIFLSIFGTVLSKYQIRSCVCNLSVNLRACQTKHKTCKTCGCERGFCVYTLRLCWCHNKTLGGQDISKYGVIRKCLSLAPQSRKMFIMKAFCSQ